MTRVIPPREAMPSESAVLRRRKPTIWRWSLLRTSLLRLASLLLLGIAAMAWLAIFGANSVDFTMLQQGEQVRAVALAIIGTMAGVGLWMLALWGVALWVVSLALQIGPLVPLHPLEQLPDILMRDPWIAGSAALFLMFIISAVLSAIEADRRERA